MDYGERVGHEPITMKRVDGFEALSHGPAGLFYWDTKGDRRYICLNVPTKAKHREDGVAFIRIPVTGAQQPVWQWDGNEDAPTLTPSLGVGGHWHGFCTAGKLVEC